ncbi:MAG: class I SAM-dependent methyltransferase [Candidatus Magasanikbacteria bacterium]
MKTLSVVEFNKYISKGKSKGSYEMISPTAWTVAYRRTFSDIPYSKEIYQELEKNLIKNNAPDLPDEYKFLAMAPLFEARHKLINKLVVAEENFQILDIAAGLTPRGLEMTINKNITYLEVDLPEIIRQKRLIVKEIFKRDTIHGREKLQIKVGDALNLKSLKRAVVDLNKNKSLTIITEGLLRYLNFPEKKTVAENVKALLKKFGGVWITPDIIYKGNLKPKFVENNNRVAKLTGINIEENKFASVQTAKIFFQDLGFTIESYPFTEVLNNLTSPKRLKMSPKEVNDVIETRVVFVMRLK